MTSWIVAIANTHPQHWKIAKRHGFWDMTKKADIRAGDDVFFWLTKSSLLSHTVATTDAARIGLTDRMPWEDSGVREYTTRFHFEVVSDHATHQPKWGAVKQETQVKAGLNFGPQRVNAADGNEWLAAQFYNDESVRPPDFYLADGMRAEVEDLLGEDLRERALRAIALRQGQPKFRKSLLDAYARTCAVTGYDAESVLEAAHISPYLGHHTNVVTNGLLLRADIHTLFDRHLLTVTADHIIRVAPDLSGSPYQELDGQTLRLPLDHAARPAAKALETHNAECTWFRRSDSLLF